MTDDSLTRTRPPFAMVPEGVLYDHGLSALAVRVYGVLDRHSGKRGIYPGRQRLADFCKGPTGRPSLSSIDRAIRELKRSGWITVSRRGRGITNRYVLHEHSRVVTHDDPESSPMSTLESSPMTTKREEVEREEVERLADPAVGDHGALFEDPPNPKKQRKRDDLFDAILESVGWDQNSLTKSAAAHVGKVKRELLEVGATPDEVRRRVAVMKSRWGPNVTMTPSALAKNWGSVGSEEVPAEPTGRAAIELVKQEMGLN